MGNLGPASAQTALALTIQTAQNTGPSSFELGKQAYEQGEFVDAVEILLASLRQGESAEIYHYLGLAYYSLETYSLALDAFEAARRLYGEDPPGLLYSLALSYFYADNVEQAQDFLNQVLNHPEATEELRALAEEQLLITLRNSSSAYLTAQTAYQNGDFETALKAYEEVLLLTPDNAEAHYYIGLSAYQLLDYDQARRSLQRAIELAPEGEYAEAARQNLEVMNKLAQNLQRGPFAGSVTLGMFGDSNVNYGDAGNNRFSSSTSESALQDLGSVLNLNMIYSLNEVTSLRYNYQLDLYWGLNDSPTRQLNSYDFNFQQHQLSMFHRLPLLDWLELYLETRGNLQILAGNVYQFEGGIRPTLTFYQTDQLYTRGYFDLATGRYPTFSERDNWNYAFGLEQYIFLWNSQTWLRFGYRFSQMLARDSISEFISEDNGRFTQLEFRSAFSHSNNQLGMSFAFPVGPLSFEVGTGFDFLIFNQPDLYREYRLSINPLTGLPLPRQEQRSTVKYREDTRLTFNIDMTWPIADRFTLLGRYVRTTNVSNISPLEILTVTSRSYLKDELSLALRWEF